MSKSFNQAIKSGDKYTPYTKKEIEDIKNEYFSSTARTIPVIRRLIATIEKER